MSQGALRRRLLTELLGAAGEDTEIQPPLRVDYGSNIRIGARSFVTKDLPAGVVAVGNPAWSRSWTGCRPHP